MAKIQRKQKDSKRLYFIYEKDDETGGWFNQFDTFEDAVGSGNGTPVVVFTGKLRLLGRFRLGDRKRIRLKARKKK